MVVCAEDYGGGGYYFNLNDAVGGTGMPAVVGGPDYTTLGFSELNGGGKKKKNKKSRKLKKSNRSIMISRSKKSKSRSNKKVYKKKSLSKKSFRKKSKKSKKSLK